MELKSLYLKLAPGYEIGLRTAAGSADRFRAGELKVREAELVTAFFASVYDRDPAHFQLGVLKRRADGELFIILYDPFVLKVMHLPDCQPHGGDLPDAVICGDLRRHFYYRIDNGQLVHTAHHPFFSVKPFEYRTAIFECVSNPYRKNRNFQPPKAINNSVTIF